MIPEKHGTVIGEFPIADSKTHSRVVVARPDGQWAIGLVNRLEREEGRVLQVEAEFSLGELAYYAGLALTNDPSIGNTKFGAKLGRVLAAGALAVIVHSGAARAFLDSEKAAS